MAVVASSLITFSLFLDLYLVRYLRRKIHAAEPKLSALAADGAAAYARSFRVMSGTAGIAFFALIFFILYFPPRAQVAPDPVALVGIAMVTLTATQVCGSAFWTYLSGLWGVYRFGPRTSDSETLLRRQAAGPSATGPRRNHFRADLFGGHYGDPEWRICGGGS